MEDKLLPCPFCGSKNLTIRTSKETRWLHGTQCAVDCDDCRCTKCDEENMDDCIKAWNTRAPIGDKNGG